MSEVKKQNKKTWSVYAPDGKCSRDYSIEKMAQDYCDFKNECAGDYIYSVSATPTPQEKE